MPSSAVPHLASRVPHPRPHTRHALQPSPRNRPRSRRGGHHTPSLWPRACHGPGPCCPGPRRGTGVAPGWGLGDSAACACPCPCPCAVCRVCACACRERLPSSASGVAAAPAKRSDARRRRERPEDGRAGELAGHSTLCLSRCSLPQSGLQPAAEPGAEPGAGRVRRRWAGAPAGSRRSRSLPRSACCAVALPCRQLRPRRPTQAPAMRAAG